MEIDKGSPEVAGEFGSPVDGLLDVPVAESPGFPGFGLLGVSGAGLLGVPVAESPGFPGFGLLGVSG
ncbi:MAG: hypothetical protein C4288_03815 [Leptolyngbya sp. ERB_1_1]